MSNKPPTLNYQTPIRRPRWFARRLGLVLLILCAIVALLGSWELQRARQAARLARQAELRQLLIARSKKLSAKPTTPTTNYFLSIRAGDGDGARPVFVVPIEPDDRGFTRPPDSQESK